MTKTAYEICEKVCELVRRENRILWMDDWKMPQHKLDELARSQKPACGTVCCLGGWAATVTGRNPFEDMEEVLIPETGYSQDGLEKKKNYRIGRELVNMAFLNLERMVGFDVGTPEYVEAALRPFEAFMKKHERLLKSHKVEVHTEGQVWWKRNVNL